MAPGVRRVGGLEHCSDPRRVACSPGLRPGVGFYSGRRRLAWRDPPGGAGGLKRCNELSRALAAGVDVFFLIVKRLKPRQQSLHLASFDEAD